MKLQTLLARYIEFCQNTYIFSEALNIAGFCRVWRVELLICLDQLDLKVKLPAAGNGAGFTGEAGLTTSCGDVVVSSVAHSDSVNLSSCPPKLTHTRSLSRSREAFQVSVRAVNPRRVTGELPQIGVKEAHFTL